MKQLTVLVEDKVGSLANLSYLLGRSKINIESISVISVGGKAVVTILVKDTKRAMEILEANGYRCLESDSLVVRLDNKPGELAKMARILADNKINIEQASVVSQDEKTSIYALRVDKPAKAEKVLGAYLRLEEEKQGGS
jgi:hypothetical protein